VTVGRDTPAVLFGELVRLLLGVAGSDELGRVGERGIGRIDHRLSDQTEDRFAHPRVAQRLDQPIVDHALGLRDQIIQRIRTGQGGIRSAFQREHADLRPVAVTDHQVVLVRDRCQGSRGRANVNELDAGVRLVSALQ
jgi:hypothetical protein